MSRKIIVLRRCHYSLIFPPYGNRLEVIRLQRLSHLYESVDTLREKYGKHTVFLGASFLAHTQAQHDGARGLLPERQRDLLPGETARKRLGIPLFMGEVH